jgi:hypothetical protein
MEAETYAAVTAESIEQEGSCRLRLRDELEIRHVLASAAPAGPADTFQSEKVRIKIVRPGADAGSEITVIDKRGGVLRADGTFRLSGAAREKLKKTIEHKCEIQ